MAGKGRVHKSPKFSEAVFPPCCLNSSLPTKDLRDKWKINKKLDRLETYSVTYERIRPRMSFLSEG